MREGADRKLYSAWCNMRARCHNPHASGYKYYGGRGITICKYWDNFDAFAYDMGPHPGNGLTLDRKDVTKGYEKENCRWSTHQVQLKNRRLWRS